MKGGDDTRYSCLPKACSPRVRSRTFRSEASAMRQFDFENSFGYLFCSTAHLLRKALDECLADEGITSRQWEVLAVLSHHEELPQRQLADCLGIESPAAATIVSRMERDGWLIREQCSDDRRRWLIRPTQHAIEVWSRSIDLIHAMRARLVAGISDHDLDTLHRICDTLRDNLAGEITMNEAMLSPIVKAEMSAINGNARK